MQLTTDRQRALELLGLDQSWSALRSGQTVTDQARALLPPSLMTEPTPLSAALLALANQVETDGLQRANQNREWAYHNRNHIRDALVALNLLLKACPHPLTSEDEQVTILAMVGHDLGHEGLPNQFPRELETQSWERVAVLLKPLALKPHTLRQIRTLILMTDPKDYPRLAQRRRSSVLTTQIGLAVDSDLFASLLPSCGFRLGSLLADEQVAAGLSQARGFATLRGRAMFLRSAPLLSDAIGRLGMPTLIEAQLSVIDQLTDVEGLRPWTPSWGAEFTQRVLDRLTGDGDAPI